MEAAVSEPQCGDVRTLVINGNGGHPVCVMPAGHDGEHRDAHPDERSFCTLVWPNGEDSPDA
jgi:hypothetical protein